MLSESALLVEGSSPGRSHWRGGSPPSKAPPLVLVHIRKGMHHTRERKEKDEYFVFALCHFCHYGSVRLVGRFARMA